MWRRPGSSTRDVEEGLLAHRLPYLAWGTGRPLVYLRGFSTTHTNPTGLQRRFELRLLQPLAEHFRVYSVGRPAGLPGRCSMADIAALHADALSDRFDGAVDVIGVSSGGSVALQLAADHSQSVHRLVIASSGHRMSAEADRAQMRYVMATAEGRRGAHFLAPYKVSSRLGVPVVAAVMWLVDPLLRPADAADMVAFAHAEHDFDLEDRLGDISAPTLVIAGEHDTVYPARIVSATAERVQHGRLVSYPATGHGGTLTHRRFVPDVLAFLQGDVARPSETG